MRKEELHDDEIGRLIKEGLSRAVAQEEERLARLPLNVMHELERRRSRRRFTWLGTPSLRPAWALAVAAAIFAVGFLVGNWVSNPFSSQGVEFVVFNPTAQQVTMAISYPVAGHNEWQDIPLRERDGLWYINLRLPPGTYEYGFKIDGRWWANDPAADYLVMSANDTINAVREVQIARDRI
ncbi:MAG: hypothetical protein A2Z21_09415 [Candidatus Fraserbacteria bacterium RBG_16_55_9]|uniref:Glycoside hydrolase family 13 N-terminal domain-containing protein n=1 Tax=Fraserbacteria sp. (strain RBG_16_55_9) TaxID=1817864 RepID=A0A1F5USR0_FRAXR|nr:MAG: hypothetical protein A2Z21_09415 [Candidatus Fraserbacteria bacterium RBG_16_55_9]